MTVYRLPFEDDGLWNFDVGNGNWDDPKTGPHQSYAFDFGHPVGGIIRAARGGVVRFVENHDGNVPAGDPVPGYGTAIHILHIDGTASAYNHLEFGSTEVVEGQLVVQGQVIARSGDTGHSFAPHLHFGLCASWSGPHVVGPDFPAQFQDKNHVAWRPRIGDTLASNNSTHRQEGWSWCHKCQGLFFSVRTDMGPNGVTLTNAETAGVCPADSGTHERTGSGNYILAQGSNASGQKNWRLCSKCRGLFFGGNPGSKCPADNGAHNQSGSENYVVSNSPDAPGQADWRWCKKCQGLFFGGNAGSKCPADNGAHSKTGSANYTLVRMGSGDPQQDWRLCSKCQGLFFGGEPGSKCPADQGAHSKTGSKNYWLVHDYLSDSAPGQPDWRRCGKCQGLFYGGASAASDCPAGDTHSAADGMNYVLVDSSSPSAPGQQGWRWCTKCQGLFFSGTSSSKCPATGAHKAHADDCQKIRDQIKVLRDQIEQIQSAPGFTQGPGDPKPGKPDPEDLAEVKKLQAKIKQLNFALKNCVTGKYRLLL